MQSGDDSEEKNSSDLNEESSWQVQSKPRRLVPQHSLSRQDLEAESTKNKAAVAAASTKPKVVRFTKEEMLTLRQPAKILSCMSDMLEIASLERLNPVCFQSFEPEDVLRIWNANKDRGGDAKGRGRGAKVGGGG
eukprot:CAMPEP_0174977792 /NCGR_PEP_ID=MMETSP0004_2-20121128/13806_1 /TAXON_ID=420556 /ORGANISM="Ochromonas sp., Strain CCMP1393" /LENGTH=134 /DNA_ID=CAMNT_0016229015 /DNA_START=162 /DNA_END=562 /DNA_ORIENTATION=-